MSSEVQPVQLPELALQNSEQSGGENLEQFCLCNEPMSETRKESGFLTDSSRQWPPELARKHNSIHMPINLLPVEVLGLVFEKMQEPSDETYQPRYTLRYTLSPPPPSAYRWLTAFTSVCHQWRRIAFSTPRFWRDISVRRGHNVYNLGRLFLSRSAPGTIRVWLPTDVDVLDSPNYTSQETQQWKTFCADLVHHVDRIELLDFPPFSSENPALLSILRAPLSKARCLTLDCIRPKGSMYEHVQKIVAPSLQRLQLEGFCPGIPLGLLAKLTHLHLLSSPYRIYSTLPVNACLRILARTPLLQELALVHVGLVGMSDHSMYEGLDPLLLPFLRKFRIHDTSFYNESLEPAVLLIRKLVLPKATDIEWTFYAAPSSTSTSSDDTALSFPWPEKVRYLSCGDPKQISETADYWECRFQQNTLYAPQEYLLNIFIHQLDQVEILAIKIIPSDTFKWPAFFRSPLVDECHVDAHRFDITIIYTLERLHKPLFPNMTTLTLWRLPGEGALFLLLHHQCAPEWQNFRQILLNGEEVTRTRMNGATFVVKLRDVVPRADIFTFEGMSAYVKAKSLPLVTA